MTPARMLALAGYIALLAGGIILARYLPEWTGIDVEAYRKPGMQTMVGGALALYVALAAVPFVPGAEIGFALLTLFGGQIAFRVWLAMVVALMIAFLAGRYVPATLLGRLLERLGFVRLRRLVALCHEKPLAERTEFLASHVPTRILPTLIRHKYLTLALLLNLPGNTLLGGGGGIAFAAGASRIYGAPQFLLTVALAAAPIPILFGLFA